MNIGEYQDLGDFTTVDKRLVFISLAGVLVGVPGAFIAVILLALIGFFTNLFYYGRFSLALVSPAQNQLGLFSIVVPVAGGLIVGLMARYGSERIRGHGIPEALEAILINKSKIEPKVTVLKPVSTAISIGSGGPFGAEGPIIMTGGAFGSVFSQFLKLSSMERKTLLVAGAAGMAATFNTPISAVLLSVELLLFEWKPRSLIPVAAASASATLVRGSLIGTGALFPIALTSVPDVGIVAFAIVVGLLDWCCFHCSNLCSICGRRHFPQTSNSLDVVADDRRVSHWGWRTIFPEGARRRLRHDRCSPSWKPCCWHHNCSGLGKSHDMVNISRVWDLWWRFGAVAYHRRFPWRPGRSHDSLREPIALGLGKYGSNHWRNNEVSFHWSCVFAGTHSRHQRCIASSRGGNSAPKRSLSLQ